MFKIVARLTVKKDKVEEFKKTAEELVKKSAAEEGNKMKKILKKTTKLKIKKTLK